MSRRFVAIWFRHLMTDWWARQQADLEGVPFVITMPSRGQVVVREASAAAESAGVRTSMVLADARALVPNILNFEEKPKLCEKLLEVLGKWCMRYTPSVSIAGLDGIILDVTGCTHLRGGEASYLKSVVAQLRGFGYDVRAAMADTIGTAWAVARYGLKTPIIPVGGSKDALSRLPPAALRLSDETIARLHKLGFKRIEDLYSLPRSVLIRRFGAEISMRLDQALGNLKENLVYMRYTEPYVEDLATPEGVASAEGIAEALNLLLVRICLRLHNDQQGARKLTFDGFRVDGKVETVEIGVNRPSRNPTHLFKLFQEKLATIEPALGIEQFRLSAGEINDLDLTQTSMVSAEAGLQASEIQDMVDRLSNRFQMKRLSRYLPQESHVPERSTKRDLDLAKTPETDWPKHLLRPIRLLKVPEKIEVTAPIPDYPPMMFRHKGVLHRIKKADGPERIENEWWMLRNVKVRDYFRLEDEHGQRYWVFRSGAYGENDPSWYLHGYFA